MASVRTDADPQPSGSRQEAGPVLTVSDLSVAYAMDRGAVLAVDRVSFELYPGEFLGIVGESGCGKSTLLFAIAQLLAPPAAVIGGSVDFKGVNMVGLTDSQLTAIRWRDMSVVMQSAMNALNPMLSIGAQFKDTLEAHGSPSADEIRQWITDPAGMTAKTKAPRKPEMATMASKLKAIPKEDVDALVAYLSTLKGK